MPTSELEPDVAAALRPELAGDEVVMRLGDPRPARAKIAIPVRNGETTLDRAVASALGQFGVDHQVIVVDNASTDRTFSIAAAWAARDPRVLVYRNPRDVGRVGNWNRCLDLLGECVYAKLLMASDELFPGFLAETTALLDAHPSAVLLRASLTMRYADGRLSSSRASPRTWWSPGRRRGGSRSSRAISPRTQPASSGARARSAASASTRRCRGRATTILRCGCSSAATSPIGTRRCTSSMPVRIGFTMRPRWRTGSPATARSRCATAALRRCRCSNGTPATLAAARSSSGSSTARARLTPPRLDLRGTSFLLPLDAGWESVVERYLREFAADDDVTLVLKPRHGADLDAIVAALGDLGDDAADLLLDAGDAPIEALAAQVDRVLAPGDTDDLRAVHDLRRDAARC